MATERVPKRRQRVGPAPGAAPVDSPLDGPTWLDNPDNLKKFFETIARASERARTREQRKRKPD